MVKNEKGESMHIYRADKNESIYDIARRYDVSPMRIAEDNGLDIRERLTEGREVLVRIPSRTYNVRVGDTEDKIASRFQISKESLMRLNPELGGKEKLYQGQLLTVKESGPSMGAISVNGYLYSGAPRDRLTALMPYLSYVTVCSAVYKDGRVHNLYPTDDTAALVKSRGRVPMLRVYMSELPREDRDFGGSVSILAKSGGYSGVTLSALTSLSDNKDRLCALTLATRRALLENDLLLFAEGDAAMDTSYMDYADAGILTYDKLHLCPCPSFDDGEARVYGDFAESGESARTFIELSSFAYSGSGYIEKCEAMRILDRKRAEISCDSDAKVIRASYGRHKRREVIYESLENTKAKLDIVSELGFMGVSFDIGRICIADLMAMASSFDIISAPLMLPKSAEVKRCNP